MVKTRTDITGWNMWEHGLPDSRLTVIKQVEDYVNVKGKHIPMYLCKCNCSNQAEITTSLYRIMDGVVLSCGCLQKERSFKANKKYNTYDLSGEFGIGYCLNTGSEFYFNLEDYDLIKDYCWGEYILSTGYHALQARDVKTGKTIRMHYLFGCKGWDHIDRNPLNNRRNNLRCATIKDNSKNKKLYKNNTSGITGVTWESDRSKWKAFIKIDGKESRLGNFINKEDAIKTRLEAEVKYFGEFAPQKHLFEQYGINTDL